MMRRSEKKRKKGSVYYDRVLEKEAKRIQFHFISHLSEKNFYIETYAPNNSNHHSFHETYSTQYILVYTRWLYVHIYSIGKHAHGGSGRGRGRQQMGGANVCSETNSEIF